MILEVVNHPLISQFTYSPVPGAWDIKIRPRQDLDLAVTLLQPWKPPWISFMPLNEQLWACGQQLSGQD